MAVGPEFVNPVQSRAFSFGKFTFGPHFASGPTHQGVSGGTHLKASGKSTHIPGGEPPVFPSKEEDSRCPGTQNSENGFKLKCC